MAERSMPQFIDEEYFEAVAPPLAPPTPILDEKRAQERRRMFAPRFDLYLVAVIGMLCAFGLLMVYSASINASFLATENASPTYFFQRQIRNFVVGMVALYIMARLDYHIWRRLSVWMMLGVIFALIAVLQFGDERIGALRALNILGNSLQPGEVAKLVVVIYMAAWLASKQRKLRDITYGILPFSIMVGTVALLIVLQPDLSAAATILATALTMFFLAGASLSQIGFIGAAAITAGFFVSTQLPYAEARISNHLNAIEDITQASLHIQASVTAFLNGGLFGVGLGEGRQKFGPLPFPHTDSVFAVIGEELGLVGCAIVIGLYVMMVQRGFAVARHAKDSFGALLAAGVTCWIVYDALLNIAVMAALVPPTGVPLPFISFGGSSLVSALAGIGLVLSVSRVSAQPVPPERRQIENLAEVEPEVSAKKEAKAPEKVRKPKPLVSPKAIRQAQKERQYLRQEALEQAKRRRFERQQEAEAKLPPEGLPEVEPLLGTVPSYSTAVAPAVELTPSTSGEERETDSDVSGRNGRGRISRISCR